MQSSIKVEVIKIIKNIIKSCEGIEIHENTLLEDLGIDSLKFVEMVLEIESHFEFQFDDEMLLIKEFPNVESIIKYIKVKKGEKE